ncbi:MAG: hypothetical protein CMC31_06460 [Flavobacteriaceae bacterium]|nr:hypothetical protein [Flavobacteriaceae bacterium]
MIIFSEENQRGIFIDFLKPVNNYCLCCLKNNQFRMFSFILLIFIIRYTYEKNKDKFLVFYTGNFFTV